MSWVEFDFFIHSYGGEVARNSISHSFKTATQSYHWTNRPVKRTLNFTLHLGQKMAILNKLHTKYVRRYYSPFSLDCDRLIWCFVFFVNRATEAGDYNIVSQMLACGYRSRDAKNQDGQTAVHIAARAGRDNILAKLIESGATVNVRDSFGYTPLHVSSLMFT